MGEATRLLVRGGHHHADPETKLKHGKINAVTYKNLRWMKLATIAKCLSIPNLPERGCVKPSG